jgi:DNA end-binding protein Ku
MARGIWKGTIGFGLVTIGIELYGVETPERIDLDLLDKRDMARIGYLKINKSTRKPVEQKDIVRGYAVGPNKYVVLSDADLKQANPESTRTIEVVGFVPRDAIPWIYFEKPYYAGPTKGSERAYALLRDTMAATDRIAIGQVVIRTRQYVAALYSFDDTLVAHLLRYDEELRRPSDLGVAVPRHTAKGARPAEIAMAKQLVSGMEMEWDPSAFRDEYRDDLMKLVKRRAKGAKAAKELPDEKNREPKVLDLMDALRRSVQGGGTRTKSTAKRSTAAHRRPRRSA